MTSFLSIISRSDPNYPHRPAQKEAKLRALARDADLGGEVEEKSGEQRNVTHQVKALRAEIGRMFQQPIVNPLTSSRWVLQTSLPC